MNEEEITETESEDQIETDHQAEQQQQEEITINDDTREMGELPTIETDEIKDTVLLTDMGEDSTELIQMILDVIFTDIFAYIVPVFFLFAVFLFSDQIIALIYNAIASQGRRRR